MKIEQQETGPDIDTVRSEYDKGSEGKLAPQKWVVKYPKVVKGVYIQERKKQKKENEEPVSGNSLGELAPPTK